MLLQKMLLVVVASLCVADGRGDGGMLKRAFPEERQIRYMFPNDAQSTISIKFEEYDPYLPGIEYDEAWFIVACITRNPFGYCGSEATTDTSTLIKVSDAMSRSLDAFNREKPDSLITHMIGSPFITTETLTTFLKWIEPARKGKDNRARTKLLVDRLSAYTFEPLKSELKLIFGTYGYKTGRTGPVGEGEIQYHIRDANRFLNSLATDGWDYAVEFERVK